VTGPDWVTVSVWPGAHPQAVLTALFDAGAQGVQEIGDAFVTHVETQSAADALRDAATKVSADARVEMRPLPNIDWSEAWKHSINAQTLGALTVAPPWLAGALDPARTIVIEPAMAFGTGEHPTTRGVIRLMQSVIRAGDRVADLGSGSAVLSIAAAKLGAANVAAIELDHDAIGNAEENVERNGVAETVKVIEGDAASLLPLVAPVRVILANIISSVLVELLPSMAMALAEDGQMILSGILFSEREGMVRELGDSGWRVIAEDHEEMWWSATVAR
jgi:ribosomal protein L11 methyltransferase